MRTRVVHLLCAGDIGGAERFLVDLASRPDQTGADHAIAILTPNPRLVELFVSAGLRVHDGGRVSESAVAFLGRSFGRQATDFFARVLREERASIAHLHTFGAHVPGTRAARLAGAKVLRTEHHMLHYPDWSCAPFTRWALRYTDRVVCVSGWVRDYIARAVPRLRAPLTVVRNGVDLSRFTPAPGPDTGPLRFAIGCRLEPRKQVHLAIDALAAVPGVLLDIAGDGSERPRLEALARERGVADRVRFLGFLPDVRPVLLGADVALSCSRDEGLPLAVLEAMALGRTVIATPVGGVPEVVREGVEGLLVEQSAPAIAGAMRALAGDRARAQALGRAARTRVEQAFSLESMCRGYRDEYAAVLGASATGSGAATG